MRAVALVDGDHAPDVVRAALLELPYEWVGAVFVGGGEKLRDGWGLEVPLIDGFGEAEAVVDLSDDPVLSASERFEWISRALAAGLSYIGADFRFDPPVYEPVDVPSIAVLGTSKRVGKTAVASHLARLLSRERDVTVVTMGRGGPPVPEVVEAPPDLNRLLALSRAGRHAASDHLEIAATAGVTTIGCRRAGGGLVGRPFMTNVAEGIRIVNERRPDVAIFDGSGSSIPPVAADRRILVLGPGHERSDRFTTYRRLISDLVIAVACEAADAFAAELRLRPLEPLSGTVAVFAAGPTAVDHLEADVVHVSRRLGDRAALREELALVRADTYVIELKGAAVDVVAEHALALGARVVLATNDVVAPGLDEALLALVSEPAAV